jgi:hypothetical protein
MILLMQANWAGSGLSGPYCNHLARENVPRRKHLMPAKKKAAKKKKH